MKITVYRRSDQRILALTLCLLYVVYFQKVQATETTPENWALQQQVEGDGSLDPSGDLFGVSVAVSGDYAIFGAHRDYDLGTVAGAAYVYQQQPSGNWIRTQKLFAADIAPIDFFGTSVAISGSTAVVGSWLENDAGAIYVFNLRQDNLWHETVKLTAFDAAPTQRFGKVVALDGNLLVAGSSNAAYVFKRDVLGNWSLSNKILSPKPTRIAGFGSSVAIADQAVVVGAYRGEVFGDETGKAYVYEEASDDNWEQVAELTASDASADDYFGLSLSADDNRILVGASEISDMGAAYLFEKDDLGEWKQVTKITSSDASLFDRFGRSVAIDSDLIAIGAPSKNVFSSTKEREGAVYVYRQDFLGDWQQVSRIDAIDSDRSDFGGRVTIESETIITSAFDRRDFSFEFPVTEIRTGAAYFLKQSNIPEPTNWCLALTALCFSVGRRRLAI